MRSQYRALPRAAQPVMGDSKAGFPTPNAESFYATPACMLVPTEPQSGAPTVFPLMVRSHLGCAGSFGKVGPG